MLLAGDSEEVRRMILRDVEQATVQSFFRSIVDLRKTDLQRDLQRLSVPTLGIYGQKDNIVSPSNAQLLARGAIHAKITMMNDSRHFPMSDEPEKFVNAMSTFLSNGESPKR
jgi:pimeloyl-ACP methyl ester carboxylesterase